MFKNLFPILFAILMVILLTGLLCFVWGWIRLHKQYKGEGSKRAEKKTDILLATGVTLLGVDFLFLMLSIDWPVNVKAGVTFIASMIPLLWAAFYSRARILYEKEEPAALFLGLLGILIAVFGGEAVLFPFHFPQWFPILYGLGVVFLITLVTGLLQMRWQRLSRQRRWLEEQDPERMLADEKEGAEERQGIKWLLLLAGCFLIAAGVPVALFYLGVSLWWAAAFISLLSATLIFLGEHHIRAHLLYGHERKFGAGWAIFLGAIFIYFYVLIYLSAIINIRSFDALTGIFIFLIWKAQERLSHRWRTKGEQRRQVIHPGTGLIGIIEQETKVSSNEK